MTEIVRNTDPSSLVTSRRHFEAVPECCAQSLPVAASVTAPLKIPAQFDKLALSPSSRGNTALQRRYSTAMSPLLPRYVPGVGGPWFTLTGALQLCIGSRLPSFHVKTRYVPFLWLQETLEHRSFVARRVLQEWHRFLSPSSRSSSTAFGFPTLTDVH